MQTILINTHQKNWLIKDSFWETAVETIVFSCMLCM